MSVKLSANTSPSVELSYYRDQHFKVLVNLNHWIILILFLLYLIFFMQFVVLNPNYHYLYRHSQHLKGLKQYLISDK